MAYGLTLEGFFAKTAAVCLAELQDLWRATFGENVDVSPGSVWGNFLAMLAEREAELWEVAQAVYSSQDRDKAEGQALDAVGALTGTGREPAEFSTVVMTYTGDPSTSVPVGTRVRTPDTLVTFELQGGAVNLGATLTAWAATTAYVVGDRRRNAGNVYVVTVAGTSGGGAGPVGTVQGATETEGTVTWRHLGAGTAAADSTSNGLAVVRTLDTGPLTAQAFTITDITTPVSGLSAAINLLDAVPGQDVEEDSPYRARQEDELASGGKGTIRAIREALLDVEGVTAVTVFENTTDVTDADGVPPHAVEALVTGGADQDIFDALFDSVAAGIATHGTTTGSSVVSEGGVTIAYPVEFSRPTVINIYVDVDVTYDAATFPADGSDQIKAAIIAWGDARPVGHDVFASGVSAQVFSVAGVLNVTDCDVGTAPAPSASTVAITSRQKADYDTSRIQINLTPGSP